MSVLAIGFVRGGQAASFAEVAAAAAQAAAALKTEAVSVLVDGDSNPALAGLPGEAVLAALLAACRELQPELVLLLGDLTGREVAPRLAARLNAGLLTDCVAFAADDELYAVRPVYGGKALAEVAWTTPVKVATVRPRAYAAAARAAAGAGAAPAAVAPLPTPDLKAVAEPVRVLAETREADGAGDLENARVIVSGGRGIGGADGFAQLREAALLLCGTVGASRAAVDAGWASPALQVGQTGKAVAPDLYLAVGISGAPQHLAGIAAAQQVVAINSDPDAPMFRRAAAGIVGDWRQVVPALIAALLRER